MANYLKLDLNTLHKVLEKGDSNYFFSLLKDTDRELEVPKQQLMRIHRRLQKFLSKIEKPAYLFSGVRGLSNVRNGEYHISAKFVHKTDIKSFYKSTSQERVKKCFLNIFKTSDDIAETLSLLCCVNGHIPTGSPLSQSISFFCNYKLFNEIEKFSKARHIRLSIYVDDLIFSRNTKFDKDFFKRIEYIFLKYSTYELHKYKKYNEDTPKPVTGVVIIDNKLYVPNKQRFMISSELARKEHILSKMDTEPEVVEKYFQSLIGRLYSASQISPKYRLTACQALVDRDRLGIKATNKSKSK